MNRKKLSIFLLGDFIIDRYEIGEIKGLAQEAVSPILKLTHFLELPGGAGNVAINLSHLSEKLIVNFAFRCPKNFPNNINLYFPDNINLIPLFDDNKYSFSLKTRYVTQNGNQLLRIDNDPDCSDNYFAQLNIPTDTDLIIISDYNKGTITNSIMDQVINSKIPFIVDPKPNHFHLYKNAFLITPNEKEWKEITPKLYSEKEDINYKLIRKQGHDGAIFQIINTTSYESLLKVKFHIPADFYYNIVNTCGCGDIVTTVLGYLLASNDPINISNDEIIKYVHAAIYCASWWATQNRVRTCYYLTPELLNKALKYASEWI